MALILHIDTAVDTASVCLANDHTILSLSKNDRVNSSGKKQKDHIAWLHVAIKEILEKNTMDAGSMDAIAVTEGPGSYTGLRIGMATAKGICYAINKPLITLNTLLVMASAARNAQTDLLCPMIDARRMEVFTAIFKKDLAVVKEPASHTINEKSFEKELSENTICFFGNGSDKLRETMDHTNAIFEDIRYDASAMVELSQEKFNKNQFADLAYAEPLYLKEFYTRAK